MTLSLAPSPQIEGNLSETSIFGEILFTNLVVNTEGFYAIFASAQGITGLYSQTFSVISKDYPKMTINSQVCII